MNLARPLWADSWPLAGYWHTLASGLTFASLVQFLLTSNRPLTGYWRTMASCLTSVSLVRFLLTGS